MPPRKSSRSPSKASASTSSSSAAPTSSSSSSSLVFGTADAARDITCDAVVAFGVDDARVVQVVVGAPRAHEVRLRVLTNALCHTDIYTLSGADPEGAFGEGLVTYRRAVAKAAA